MSDLNPDMVRTQECADAFGRMFWAFIFFLDFRIGVNNVLVDILPDFIGWLLIASSLTKILELASVVRPIRTLAYWLVFLSLFDVIEIRIPLTRSGNITTWISPLFLVGIIATVLDIMLIWKLCGLIMEMAAVVGNATIRERADFRRKLYVAFAIFLTLSVLVAYVVPPFAIVALIVGFPVSIVVFCLMMGLMKGTENMCRRAAGERDE